MTTFSQELRHRAKLKGLTLDQVAESVGVTMYEVDLWEAGHAMHMGVCEAFALSTILGWPTEDMVQKITDDYFVRAGG